jgi:hypothetical protein
MMKCNRVSGWTGQTMFAASNDNLTKVFERGSREFKTQRIRGCGLSPVSVIRGVVVVPNAARRVRVSPDGQGSGPQERAVR